MNEDFKNQFIQRLDQEIEKVNQLIMKIEKEVMQENPQANETGMLPTSRMPIAFHLLVGKSLMLSEIKTEWLK